MLELFQLFQSNKKTEKDQKASNSKKPKKPRAPKVQKFDGKTLEQQRRMIGGEIKKTFNVNKKEWYNCDPDCHMVVPGSTELFRALFVPSKAKITPEIFSDDTPVVVAELDGREEIADLFGASKVTRDFKFRYGGGIPFHCSKMDIVFKPKEKEIRMW